MNNKGSRWWKFDFHVHTPASNDYKDSKLSALDWLKACMTKKLDCVVVTDHNSGAWIDKLKNEYENHKENSPDYFRELIIYPGVEISVSQGDNRVHLLAVFDPSKGTDEITALLGACGITDKFGDEKNISTTKSFEKTVETIIQNDGIPIPAHIDGEKGFLKDYVSPQKGATPELKRSLKKIYAAEFCNANAFENSEASIKKIVDQFAVVCGSDAHSTDEILKNGPTWIKMSNPGIEGLKLALMDYNLCVKNQDNNPNVDPDFYIKSMEIENMKHCGRIEGKPFKIDFHTHLNTIIGGRGTGKSTIIESIRIAARRERELDKFDLLKEQIDLFMQNYNKNGVMLDNTFIKLIYSRNGEEYKIQWNQAGNAEPLLEKERDHWKTASTEYDKSRFLISIYSQKQINSMAGEPSAIIEIIDKSINSKQVKDDIKFLQGKYLKLSLEERELINSINEKTSIESQKKDIENDLKQYEEKGHGDILRNYQKRIAQQSGISIEHEFSELTENLRKIAEEIMPDDFPSHLFKDDDYKNEIESIYNSISNDFSEIQKNIEESAKRIEKIVLKRQEAIQSSKWLMEVNKTKKEYDELVKKYEEKGGHFDLSLYGEWTREKAALERRIKAINQKEQQVSEIKEEKEIKLKEILKKRNELFDMRSEFLNKTLGDNAYVKMELLPFAEYSNLEQEYRDILGLDNNNFSESVLDIENESGLLWRLFNAQKTEHKTEIIDLIEALKKDTYKISEEENTVNINRKFIKRLNKIKSNNPENLDKLMCWYPGDRLVVKYAESVNNEKKKKFYPLSGGSAGQKASAILAFLLSYGTDPIIIDQPEDDLDNELIYELIVKQLHENKSRRQVIVVTHNPNIVVNGDAELVHVLKFNGQVDHDSTGGLEEIEIRNRICEIMEGGREAFEKRYKRITMAGEK